MSSKLANARVKREIAKTLKKQGLRNYEIAAQLGVTAQHVSYMLNYAGRMRKETLRRTKKERPALGRRYRCGVCGEKGHNAQRHQTLCPEDIQWLKKH